jgi:hypothetical protein
MKFVSDTWQELLKDGKIFMMLLERYADVRHPK